MIEIPQSALWLAQAPPTWLQATGSWIKAHYETISVLVAIFNAFATLVAVGVALFLQYSRDRLQQPKLQVKWRQRDFTIEADPATGNEIHRHRLQVINIRNHPAEGVEATVVDVYEREVDIARHIDRYKLVPEFLPTVLRWTHSESARRVFIPGKAGRLVNFGTFTFIPTDQGTISRFKVETETEPLSGYTTLSEGRYVVRVIVSARNAPSAAILIRLGVGKGMHHEKFYEHEDHEAPFSIAVADKSIERQLDDRENVFDDDLRSLKTWGDR